MITKLPLIWQHWTGTRKKTWIWQLVLKWCSTDSTLYETLVTHEPCDKLWEVHLGITNTEYMSLVSSLVMNLKNSKTNRSFASAIKFIDIVFNFFFIPKWVYLYFSLVMCFAFSHRFHWKHKRKKEKEEETCKRKHYERQYSCERATQE